MMEPMSNDFFAAEHTRWNRFEKLEYLEETTTFKANALAREMISWMTDDDFNQFYEHLCTTWDIAMDHQQLNNRYN